MENQKDGPVKWPWSDKIKSCSHGIKLWYGTTKTKRQVVMEIQDGRINWGWSWKIGFYHVVVMENQKDGPFKWPWFCKIKSCSYGTKLWYGTTKTKRQVVMEIQDGQINWGWSWKIGFYHVVVMENQEDGPFKWPWFYKIESCSYGIKLWYGTTKTKRQVVIEIQDGQINPELSWKVGICHMDEISERWAC